MKGMRQLPLHQAPPPRSARVSLTDRCDLACVYCRPSRSEEYATERLDARAYQAVLDGLLLAGIRRIRFTGGEPLVAAHVVEAVRHAATLRFDDIALTTNATRLEAMAGRLREAGLHRLNVSVDTLDPERFRRLTRGGDLRAVLAGIEMARRVGFPDIKLNCVVMRGENDSELAEIVDWAWQRNLTPRFLEVMRIGEGARLPPSAFVSFAEMRARLSHLLEDHVPEPEPDRGPARYLLGRGDPGRRVGFISGTSDTYCAGCDRLRVSAAGHLRPCLARDDSLPIASAASAGDAQAVAGAVDQVWRLKPDGRTFRGCTESSAASLSIRAIGG